MKCVSYCGRIFAQCFVILSASEVSKRWCALGLRGGGFVWIGVLFGFGLFGLVGLFGLLVCLDTSGYALSMTQWGNQYDRIGELV